MKDKYCGDVNDYQKCGLLRILSKIGGLSLGICWMLTPDDGKPEGQFTRYLLELQEWRKYDQALFDSLYQFVISHPNRCVQRIEDLHLLPRAVFWDPILKDGRNQREEYFSGMHKKSAGQDIVFFDPDNGIEVKSRPMGKTGSSNYIYWIELLETYHCGHSLLVYQHFPRVERTEFICRLKKEIRSRLMPSEVYCLCTTHVVYFLVAQPKHRERIVQCMEKVDEVWGEKIKVMK